MNKWIKLDKNNLPSDILVEGKYEFRGFAPRVAEPFLFSRGVNAIADIDIGSPVQYRKKSTEPKPYTGKIRTITHSISPIYGAKIIISITPID